VEAHYTFHPSTIWVRPLFTELGPNPPSPPKKADFAMKQTNICRRRVCSVQNFFSIFTPPRYTSGTGYCLRSISLFIYLFVCLFLCQQDYEKSAGPICMKFSGKVWSDHGLNDLITFLVNSEKLRDAAMRNTGRGLLCFSTTACCGIYSYLFIFITPPPIGGQGIVFDRFLCLFLCFFVSLSARSR